MTSATLTPLQLKELEALIKQQLGQLLGEQDEKLAETVRHERSESETEHSAMIAATPLAQAEQTLSDQHDMEIHGLRQALERIESGAFGVCDDCDAPIAYARLKAYPMAIRCIGCQEKFEHHR